jgi:hypothetical protein
MDHDSFEIYEGKALFKASTLASRRLVECEEVKVKIVNLVQDRLPVSLGGPYFRELFAKLVSMNQSQTPTLKHKAGT